TPGPGAGAPDQPGDGDGGAASGEVPPGANGAAGSPGAGAAPGGGGPAVAEIPRLRGYGAAHPQDAHAVLKLANLNFDISNWGRARDLYTQYLGLREPNPDVLTDLGTCYRQLRDFEHALAQFRRAQALAPSHWKSRFAEVVVLAFDL